MATDPGHARSSVMRHPSDDVHTSTLRVKGFSGLRPLSVSPVGSGPDVAGHRVGKMLAFDDEQTVRVLVAAVSECS